MNEPSSPKMRHRTGPFARAALVTVVLVVGLPSPAGAATSTTNGPGANVTFFRTGYTVNGVNLRVRGFLNDACLSADAPCNALTGGAYRQEATAQAKVIRHLSGEAPPIPTVQWEVAPDPDGTCAANTVTTPASDDNTIDLSNTPGSTSSAAPTCRFRVDVMIDHGPGNDPTIIEVKRWRGPATQTAVDTQLQGYVTKGKTIGLNFLLDQTLNTAKWSRAYTDGVTNPDGTTNNYCVWADRDFGGHRGNVYFAPWASTPEDVRLGTAQGGDGGMGCARASTPTIDPESQSDSPPPCQFNWTVTVAEIPNAFLKFTYGDGSDNAPYPAIPNDGNPNANLNLSHSFPEGPFQQTATPVNQAGATLTSPANSSVTCAKATPQLQPAAIAATAGVATFTTLTLVEVLNRTSTLTLNFGDGTATDTETIPAGIELVTLTYSHTYASAGTDTQTATVAETGASSTSTVTVTQPALPQTC